MIVVSCCTVICLRVATQAGQSIVSSVKLHYFVGQIRPVARLKAIEVAGQASHCPIGVQHSVDQAMKVGELSNTGMLAERGHQKVQREKALSPGRLRVRE
jgi:hypothetical protein